MSERTNSMRDGLRGVAAVAFAVIVNLLVFVALESLNRAAQAEGVRQAEMTVVRLQPQSPPSLHKPEPPKPEERTPEPEEITLDVQFEPTVAEVSEVTETPLDVSVPTVAPVRVSVIRTPPKPPAPPQRVSPAPRPSAPRTPSNAEDIDQPPRELNTPRIEYPRSVLRRRLSGSVTIKLLINEQGRVDDMRIVRVDGPQVFADAIDRDLRGWRFTVPRDRGQPVRVWATKTITFQPQVR